MLESPSELGCICSEKNLEKNISHICKQFRKMLGKIQDFGKF